MKIAQTVEIFAASHQESHGNSTWFQQLTIGETPPADLLQTFQPKLAQEVLLLVVIQTSSVQHDISIYLKLLPDTKALRQVVIGTKCRKLHFANTIYMSGANKKQKN